VLGIIFKFAVMEEKLSPDQLQAQLWSLLVPKEILIYFEIIRVVELATKISIYLTEKQDLIPEKLKGKEPVLNGYLNDLELQTYPIQGKSCHLVLRRRRWKEQGTDGRQSYWNEYDFAAEGTKATKAFGAFLKEYYP
jgi:hypothetical protein